MNLKKYELPVDVVFRSLVIGGISEVDTLITQQFPELNDEDKVRVTAYNIGLIGGAIASVFSVDTEDVYEDAIKIISVRWIAQ